MEYISSLLEDASSPLLPLLSQLLIAYREIGTSLRENAYSSEQVVSSSRNVQYISSELGGLDECLRRPSA